MALLLDDFSELDDDLTLLLEDLSELDDDFTLLLEDLSELDDDLTLLLEGLPELDDNLTLLLDDFLSLRGVEDDKAIFLLLLDDSPSAGSVTLSLLLESTSPELDSPNSD